MYEITEILMNQKKRNEVTVDFSLTGTLEAIIRGYYVEGEGGVNPDRWLRVYYSPLADPEKTIISTFKFPESLVAYVSLDDQIAIVKNEILNKFKVDTDGYGLSYYSTESFDIEEYFYSSKEQLPSDFREIV